VQQFEWCYTTDGMVTIYEIVDSRTYELDKLPVDDNEEPANVANSYFAWLNAGKEDRLSQAEEA
jgi:hypothetical protein